MAHQRSAAVRQGKDETPIGPWTVGALETRIGHSSVHDVRRTTYASPPDVADRVKRARDRRGRRCKQERPPRQSPRAPRDSYSPRPEAAPLTMASLPPSDVIGNRPRCRSLPHLGTSRPLNVVPARVRKTPVGASCGSQRFRPTVGRPKRGVDQRSQRASFPSIVEASFDEGTSASRLYEEVDYCAQWCGACQGAHTADAASKTCRRYTLPSGPHGTLRRRSNVGRGYRVRRSPAVRPLRLWHQCRFTPRIL